MAAAGAERLTPELEARGMRAYEQARAFERMRSWRLPVSYAVLAAIPLIFCAVVWQAGRIPMAELSAGVAAALAVWVFLQWRYQCARYARNQALLAEMAATYGEALPWVKVERHFAELEKLKRELAGE